MNWLQYLWKKRRLKKIVRTEIKRRKSSYVPSGKQEQQVRDWNSRTPVKEVFKNDV